MEDASVFLAIIALAGGAIEIIRRLVNKLIDVTEKQTQAQIAQAVATEKQTIVLNKLEKTVTSVGRQGKEQYKFMRNLNGKLEEAIAKKAGSKD